MRASYDYFGWRRLHTISGDSLIFRFDSTDIAANLSGSAVGVYAAQRVRIFPILTAEAGLRYDRHSYSGDAEVQPRLNVELAPAVGPTIRAAWGRFSQAQGIHEMRVQDGIDHLYPAEVAEHRMLGLEHRLGEGFTLRLEGYERRTSRVRPYFTNHYNHVNTFPEVREDRQLVSPERGLARGIEVFVKQEPIRTFGWSASYALASAEDLVDGAWVPRPYDQRHTIALDVHWRPSPPWRITAAWQHHSGWPYTSAGFTATRLRNGGYVLEPTFGPLLGKRLPAYQRVDARVTRLFRTRRGELSAFIDVFNVLNRDNIRAYEYSITVNAGQVRVFPHPELQLPRLPTFGVTWEF
jgi:hypothetical protein